ncbi:MAG: Tn3 family transposase, partial [Actinomycetota bacterium]
MRVDLDELVADWTLVDDEPALAARKQGVGRLAFALQLKAYGRTGRFIADSSELSNEVVDYVARQVGVAPALLEGFDWSSRAVRFHRAEIRNHFGFSECSVDDAERGVETLVERVTQRERSSAVVRDELLAWFRRERIEPPAGGRLERLVRSALHRGEVVATSQVAARLPADVCALLDDLVAESDGDDEVESGWSMLLAEPGEVSLNSMLVEIDKLNAVRHVDLPAGLLDGLAPSMIESWRARAAVESPSHLRRHRDELRWSLLATTLVVRESQLIDALVDLLIATVHRIGARAGRKVTKELTNAFKKVGGKENILFSIAEAAIEHPDDAVRAVVYPAVAGGEKTLQELVHEYRTKGPEYDRTVRATLKASYTNHYRRGLIELLDVLEFRSNNTAHRPVLDALDLVKRHAGAGTRYFPVDETIPVHRGLKGDWRLSVFVDVDGRKRTKRPAYEICMFQALRDQLRCKEIWVVGADKWRNPDDDLPADFAEHRTEHYSALRQPPDPSEFIGDLRAELEFELDALDRELPRLDWVDIADRGKRGAIQLSPLARVPEPGNLRRLKDEVVARWGKVQMIDILKEAVLRSGCLDQVTATLGRGDLATDVLAERLLLTIYAYGTNTGIAGVGGGEHGHSEDDLRYVRRRYLNPTVAQRLAIEIANATFTARRSELWGEGSSVVASDSTHIGAVDQNIFTEWHARYRGRGVLIYWHVEQHSMAIHSQLISCSASEVAAMIEGTMRHGTDMVVEGNYVDSHGQSEIGFGITRLLGFDLLPRIKRINHVRLYPADTGSKKRYPNLVPAMNARAIRWSVIGEQYDQMIKYATAIRTRSASTEAILRRFMRSASMHPTYEAMLEVGRAQRTIFLCRYLRDRQLQRDTNSGLNVVESWNSGNDIVFHGNRGQLTSNRQDERELSMLCLRILQAALVYVNTLMLQDVLADPGRLEQMSAADRRGLTWTPLWLTFSGRWVVDVPPGRSDLGGGPVVQPAVRAVMVDVYVVG